MWSYYLIYKEKDKIRLMPFRSMNNMLKYCDIYESKKFSQYLVKYWVWGYSTVKAIPPLHDLRVRKAYNL
jgi:hypothetical protein